MQKEPLLMLFELIIVQEQYLVLALYQSTWKITFALTADHQQNLLQIIICSISAEKLSFKWLICARMPACLHVGVNIKY